MKMSAAEACEMGIVDAVLPEGPAPAHEKPGDCHRAGTCLCAAEALLSLCEEPTEKLLAQRYERFIKF